MLQSFGYLKYDPKNIETKYQDWWLILQCDEGLTAYYRHWIAKEYPTPVVSWAWIEKAKIESDLHQAWFITQRGLKLNRSAWGSHVSVIRGEIPKKIRYWRKYQDRRIAFEYDPAYLNSNGKHWWFRIFSPELEEIRLELGLTPQPKFYNHHTKRYETNPFHLTVGVKSE